jgi:hypothetical protein
VLRLEVGSSLRGAPGRCRLLAQRDAAVEGGGEERGRGGTTRFHENASVHFRQKIDSTPARTLTYQNSKE